MWVWLHVFSLGTACLCAIMPCPSRYLTRLCSEARRTSQLKGHFLAAALPTQFKCPLGTQAPSPTPGLGLQSDSPSWGWGELCVEKPCKALGTWLLAMAWEWSPGDRLDTHICCQGECQILKLKGTEKAKKPQL